MTQVVEQLRQLNSELNDTAVRYTSLASWEKAQTLGQLRPQTPVVPNYLLGLPEWAYKKHIFAISTNELDKWKNNKNFPDIMKKLTLFLKTNAPKNKRNILEISFDIRITDEPYVLDLSRRSESLYGPKRFRKSKNFLGGFYCGAPTEWEEYINSRVSYFEYRENYCLPEIIIGKPVGIERVNVERVLG